MSLHKDKILSNLDGFKVNLIKLLQVHISYYKFNLIDLFLVNKLSQISIPKNI